MKKGLGIPRNMDSSITVIHRHNN